MATITIAQVIGAGMAPWDVNKFKAAFGTAAEVTAENVERARKFGLQPEAFFAAIASPIDVQAFYDAKNEISRQYYEEKKKASDAFAEQAEALSTAHKIKLEAAFVNALASVVAGSGGAK